MKKGFFVRTKLVKTSKNAVNCLSMGLLGDCGSLNCRIYFPHCYYQSAISSNQGQINISTHSLSLLIAILKIRLRYRFSSLLMSNVRDTNLKVILYVNLLIMNKILLNELFLSGKKRLQTSINPMIEL